MTSAPTISGTDIVVILGSVATASAMIGGTTTSADALTGRYGPFAPGDIAARADIGYPLDPRPAPRPGAEKRNRHQVPHALIAQDGRFPVAQARGPMVPDLPPPWLALRQHRTAHTNTGLDRQPQTRRRASALTATDDRDLRARLADG